MTKGKENAPKPPVKPNHLKKILKERKINAKELMRMIEALKFKYPVPYLKIIAIKNTKATPELFELDQICKALKIRPLKDFFVHELNEKL